MSDPAKALLTGAVAFLVVALFVAVLHHAYPA